MNLNLYHLKIPLPVAFEKGKPSAYEYKSVGSILDDKIWFEMLHLQEWVTNQILDYIDWDISEHLTTKDVEHALELFSMLGINPKGCIVSEDNEKDNIESNE